MAVVDKTTTPEKTERLADGTMAMEESNRMIWQEEIKEHVRHKKKLKTALKKLHALIWGHTSDAMRTKVQALDEYKTVVMEQDPINMLEFFKTGFLQHPNNGVLSGNPVSRHLVISPTEAGERDATEDVPGEIPEPIRHADVVRD